MKNTDLINELKAEKRKWLLMAIFTMPIVFGFIYLSEYHEVAKALTYQESLR